jgi:acetyl esterase/lipase
MNIDLLDSELATALSAFPAGDIWQDLDLTRIFLNETRASLNAALPVIDTVVSKDYQLSTSDNSDDFLIRVYAPIKQSEPLPALLWIHGGGYVMGSVSQDDYLVRSLVAAVGCMMVSVEYRLAPEHPFPAPLDDCYCALKWLAANTETLNVDPQRIAIGGASAGGGLAAALALMARDKAEVDVVFQFLLCPMIDDSNSTESSYQLTDPRVWNRHNNLKGWAAYLNGDESSIYAAATRAEDLAGLPPVYIAVGTVDMFVDENREYASRLQDACVNTQLEIFDGGFHGFEFFVPEAAISQRALATHHQALKQALFSE